MILYHFTCDHGRDGITATGEIRPHPHPWLTEPLAWFTDLDSAIPNVLGLTSHTLHCDRTAHRFQVDTTEATWWPRYARLYVPGGVREEFESAPGAMPAHWWVSRLPVPIHPADDCDPCANPGRSA